MSGDNENVVVIVPCFNEAKRLDATAFRRLASIDSVTVLFVDDGSTDDTLSLLETLEQSSGSISILSLPSNVGKGEAVRLGMRSVMSTKTTIVGYLDADLATPVDDFVMMLEIIKSRPEISVVMGSRVKCLGRNIQRSFLRHAVGRVYATGAALALGISVYDTQCGAKLFRVNCVLEAACERHFGSKWAFDVRILSRLLNGTASVPGLSLCEFIEVPLNTWRDVPGSKIHVVGGLVAFVELVPVAWSRRRVRRIV